MLSGLAWLAIPLTYELIIRRSTRRESVLQFLRSQVSLAFDLGGLALGALVVVCGGLFITAYARGWGHRQNRALMSAVRPLRTRSSKARMSFNQ